jgi:hypothetical protein
MARPDAQKRVLLLFSMTYMGVVGLVWELLTLAAYENDEGSRKLGCSS